MQINLVPRNIRFTDKIRKQVADKITGLTSLAPIVNAHVILAQNDGENPDTRFTVKAHLAVPGPDVHAEESGYDPMVALNKVSSRLARQLRKRHTALIDKNRQRMQRIAELNKRVG